MNSGSEVIRIEQLVYLVDIPYVYNNGLIFYVIGSNIDLTASRDAFVTILNLITSG